MTREEYTERLAALKEQMQQLDKQFNKEGPKPLFKRGMGVTRHLSNHLSYNGVILRDLERFTHDGYRKYTFHSYFFVEDNDCYEDGIEIVAECDLEPCPKFDEHWLDYEDIKDEEQ